MNLKNYITDVNDFPKPGVIFKDITPLLNDANAFKFAIQAMAQKILESEIDVIVAPEARGFLFAAPIAFATNKRLVLIRKPGKLPRKTVQTNYSLEYGAGELQIHEGDLKPKDRVAIIDDVLATGGTTEGIIKLIESQGAEVKKILFLADLKFLHSADIFKNYNLESLLEY
ncbi:adenine phosphoribosyltransferase [Spiroplasma sabaudiense Ar-1343]|uniref:Adenine phosphoribosyltransferase n=1 Tax=Spiroplasma sabaudiense Ar-1343 TaxID=1276257 RepID=W6A9F0_9MOLU|nr:adenine phosphoribosyltransferase [Spiroplasma sabaudiense]AHI53748.1 adenine phosphoribosyltransferase [Spiroplasma sabaudiense Ar-1343]